jgi:two-component system sensor histidine kinase KdpD
MAKGLRVSWIALHVEAPSPIRPSSEDILRLEEHMRLAERLGAETVSLQGPRAGETILDFARARNVSKIIVGKPTHPRWKDRLFGSLLDEIVRGSEGIEVYVITGDTPTETRPSAAIRSRSPLRPKPWLLATFSVFGCFSLAWLMKPVFAMADLVMVFLLGIVLVAARWGMGPSFLATLLSIALFDFFFVPPFHTFAVSEHGYLITFGVMFLVAIVISRLTARVREQADAARLREQRTAALYGLSRDLVHERTLPELATVASRHIGEGLACRVAVFVPGVAGKLTPLGNPEWKPEDEKESRAAEWVFRQRKPAGMGMDTHADANGLFFPLLATSGPVGVLGLWKDGPRGVTPEQLHLLEGLAGQTALAMERAILAEEAQRALVAAERESLRSTLLSSVSHDLRTPLAAITGAGTALLRNEHLLDAASREELLQTIVEEAAHLNRIIRNVLDMTRLESGAIRLNREWQSLEEIVGAVTNRLSGQFHDHPLSIELPPGLPLIPCDGLLIEQVLRNLLENAVKYTPAGTPITLSAICEDQEVQVTVADRGYGIPPEEAGRIFEKFVRGKQAGGVGLGLAICQGMVTAHMGRIWMENQAGGGAKFTFTLPTAQTPPPVEQEVEESVG